MRVVDKILRVVAVIASEEAKICMSKSRFIIFFGFSMGKIHFLQKVLKKWSSFRKKNFHSRGGGGQTQVWKIPYFFFLFFEGFPKSGVTKTLMVLIVMSLSLLQWTVN